MARNLMIKGVLLLFCMSLLTGCETMNEHKGATTGAGVGAATGAPSVITLMTRRKAANKPKIHITTSLIMEPSLPLKMYPQFLKMFTRGKPWNSK